MEHVYLPLQLAPSSFTQPILPNWSFNLLNVNLGASSSAATEQEVLQNVGSYGKQIGHLAEALELVIAKLKLLDSKQLSPSERDTLQVFLGDVSAVRKIKGSQVNARALAPSLALAGGAPSQCGLTGRSS